MTEFVERKTPLFSESISKEQAKDTGLALLLILLLVGIATGISMFYKLCAAVLILVMTVPGIFRPLAVVWFGISRLLGEVMSQFILTVVYVLLVIPVAFLRRAAGKDTLMLKSFRKGSESVMAVRNHRFLPSDLEKPY
jgi:hypothetical protein